MLWPVDRLEEAQALLAALGLPKDQQNEMSGLTLLALANIGPDDHWTAAERRSLGVTKGIMAFMHETYGKNYAPNTRETVRRQVLHQFVQAGIADYNPDSPDLPTNSPRAHYAISEAALSAVRAYGTPGWKAARQQFLDEVGTLIEKYNGARKYHTVPVILPDGSRVTLSPGVHNELQAAIVMEFAPRFAPGAELLYLGDTAKKILVVQALALEQLGLSITRHDKLPDVVLHDTGRNWLLLIEAVTSHGPMNPKRVLELGNMLSGSHAWPVYVSAFPDLASFRSHMRDIAWETEVWLADNPDHLIHFNGDRFLGPKQST
jgi:type II restriction enzyme